MSLITPLLGPVDDNIYYKRDDLYCPWGDVNGGKVRQTRLLFSKYVCPPGGWRGVANPAGRHSWQSRDASAAP